ncbi:MAG TPA: hypothetical protein PKN95_10760 [Verrucomicrobiota bacterium]|nr:hypothetical protein [Verrucomicrobiota bacterium]HNT15674.1 hypothetical protein [Verrucomicrobiota bacterium]
MKASAIANAKQSGGRFVFNFGPAGFPLRDAEQGASVGSFPVLKPKWLV